MSDSDKAAAAAGGAEKPEADLDELLDSALSDFDKPLPKAECVSSASKPSPNKAAENCDSDQWSGEFQKFQNVMDSFLKDNPNLANFGAGDGTFPSAGSDFGASLAESLQSLANSAQSMTEPSPEELANFLQSVGLDAEDGALKPDEVPDALPLMQKVMQNLLSKELLYPSLKELVGKYPEWLEQNEATLDKDLFQKYTSQYNLMKQVCDEFEAEDSSSSEGKSKSFDKIFALMEKMHACGNPPKELLGDVPTDFPLDEEGNFRYSEPGQCCVM